MRDVLESMCDGELSAMTVSRVAAELDEKLASFRSRRLDHASWPYLMLDARYEKVRVDGRVVSQAVLVVVGFTCGGRREVLDWRVSDGETEQAWGGVPVAEGPGAFGRHAGRLRRPPRDPGRRRPPLPGGVAAVPGAPEAGAGQQGVEAAEGADEGRRRCSSRGSGPSARRGEEAAAKWERLKCAPRPRRRREGLEDCLAVLSFPEHHRRRLASTNLLENIMKRLRKRTRVVGIFPNRQSCDRLVGSQLLELREEWQAAEKGYFNMEAETETEIAAA